MKKTLIIGGAGYIGSHVNKYFNQQGYETIVLDNLSRGFKQLVRWGELKIGDVGDVNILREIFAKNKIDVVVHLSALAYVGESVENPGLYYETNVAKTIMLLNAMVEHGVRKFIFSSTCATYGNAQYLPINEIHPQNPINPYGRTKLMVEWILKDFAIAHGIKSCALRYFNAAGADESCEIGELHEPETHLIPVIFEVLNKKRSHIDIFGDDYDTPDGTCIRDYVHVTDLAQAHFLASQYLENHQGFHDFNLGYGRGHSVKEIISAIEKVVGSKVEYKISPRRPGDPAELIGSGKKAIDLLGWNPRFTELEKIIETAWNWAKIQSIPSRI
jgi:UDP-glucose 4-epimerase